MRDGLLSPLPTIPCRYFYDDHGSALFDDITRQPEYYPTRTEEALLASIAADVVGRVRPRELVELGSGVGRKIRLVLDAMQRIGHAERCTLMDINQQVLVNSLFALGEQYPGLALAGIAGDFTNELDALGPGGGRLILLLASTIGNFEPPRVPAFLASVAQQLAPGDGFLVGLDLVKDGARLEAAYNDAAGVTAEFNRNVLRVVNVEFDADFDPHGFAHRAFWDAKHSWIEMRLVATRDMRVHVGAAGLVLDFPRGREIRTELSCKFTRPRFSRQLLGTGLALAQWYTDEKRQFALALCVRHHDGPVLEAS